jgi:predicted aspartyl protease
MRCDIHFRLVGGDQPLIVIPARFNGSEPVLCALDTGASHAMLLPEVAARLGITVEETRKARGAGGTLEVGIGTAASIQIGAAVASDVPVLVSDELRRIGARIGLPLGGNIGFNVLQRFRVTVDYASGFLTLATPDEPADTRAARAELPFTLAHPSKPLILIPVTIGEREHVFALDTGASTTVVSPEVARAHAIESTAMPDLTGGGGVLTAAAGVLPMVVVGKARVSRVRVAIVEFLDSLGQALGTRLDGILGTNVLRRFRVSIDYPGKTLRLE